MKRTKAKEGTKFKRRKTPKNNNDPFAPSPLGGYLPDPPEDCPAKKSWVERDGRSFIDLQICLRQCRDLLCERHKKYTEVQRKRRRNYLESIKKDEHGNS